MKKLIIRTIITLVLVGSWCLTYCYIRLYRDSVIEQPLPSIKQIQERVGAVPDGKLGPETQRLWDKKICDQYAAKYDSWYEEKPK